MAGDKELSERKVALVGPPIQGKAPLMNSLALNYLEKLTANQKYDSSCMNFDDVLIDSVPHRRQTISIKLSSLNRKIFLKIVNYPGNLFFFDSAIRHIIADASAVWFVAMSRAYFADCSPEELSETKDETVQYLERIFSESKMLSKAPGQVPWLILIDKKEGMKADDSYLTHHPLVVSNQINTLVIDVRENIAPLLSYLASNRFLNV